MEINEINKEQSKVKKIVKEQSLSYLEQYEQLLGKGTTHMTDKEKEIWGKMSPEEHEAYFRKYYPEDYR